MRSLAVDEAVFAVIAPSIRPKPQRRRKDGTLIPVRSYSWTKMTHEGMSAQIDYVRSLRHRYSHLWLIEVVSVRKHPQNEVYATCHSPREMGQVTAEQAAAIMREQFPNAEVTRCGSGMVLRHPDDLVKLHLLDRVE